MNGSLLLNTATYLCDEFNLGMTLQCESNANISRFHPFTINDNAKKLFAAKGNNNVLH